MAKRGRKPGRPKVVNKKESVIITKEEHVTSSSTDNRQNLTDDKTYNDTRPQVIEDAKPEESETTESDLKDEVISPPSFRNPLERNLGSGFSDIEFTHPNLKGYWAIDVDIPKYLRFGYEYCKKEWVKDYELLFSHKAPGTGDNPNGMVTHEGHTLLIASDEIATKRRDYYRANIIDPRKSIKGNLSKSEMAQRNYSDN